MTRPICRLFLSIISVLSAVASAESELKPKWEITQGLKNPESVYFDSGTQTLFISNVAGEGTRADSTGWITKASLDGKVVQEKWISGLNAPKGMRAHAGFLWVSDIQYLLKIDIKKGAVVGRVFVPSARFLNDVAIGNEGEVYVSDTLTSRIYLYREPVMSVFAQGDSFESPNGLLVKDGKLWVAAWGLTSDFSNTTKGRFYSINLKTLAKEPVTPEPVGNLDGLEWMGNDAFLISDWVAGRVYRIGLSGTISPVLSGFKGSADIAWVPESNLIVVPRMGEDRVSAYTLNSGPK